MENNSYSEILPLDQLGEMNILKKHFEAG